MTLLAESDVESAALAWLEALGWAVEHGGDLAPDGPAAERRDFSQVVLERRLRDALLPRLMRGEVRVTVHEEARRNEWRAFRL